MTAPPATPCDVCDPQFQMKMATRLGQTMGSQIDLDQPGKTLLAVAAGLLGVEALLVVVDTVCDDRRR
jgi:hypothetical protein